MKVLYIRELNQNAENYNRKHILGKTNLENEKKELMLYFYLAMQVLFL